MRKIAKFILVASLSACSPQPGSPPGESGDDGSKVANPFRGVMQDRSSKSADGALFVEKCSMCHRQMGMSLSSPRPRALRQIA